MIAFIITLSIALGLIKMVGKAIQEYDSGRISREEYKDLHKESWYFK